MRSLLIVTLPLSVLMVSCVGGVIEDASTSSQQDGLAGQPCYDSTDCALGLRCLALGSRGVCVTPCTSDADCGGARCDAVPGSLTGFCGDDPATPNPSAPGTGLAAPVPHPGGEDAPPVPDPEPHPNPDDGPDGTPPPDREPDPDPDPDPDREPDPDPEREPDPTPQPEPCSYPVSSGSIAYGQVMPPLRYPGAYRADGSTFTFDLEEIHCGAEYADYGTMVVVVSAEWCPSCPQYIRSVDQMASELDAAGALIVYVEVEDRSYRTTDHTTANSAINHIIGSSSGMRLGDPDRTFYNSPIVTSFPSAFMVRLSDMQIIADQNRNGGWMLDYVTLARNNPRGSGSGNGTGGGSGGGATGNTDGCTEEAQEPNDSPSSAAVLAHGTIEGGICGGDMDFYDVSVSGSWTLSLSFSHATGDLDVYVWDAASNQPLVSGGQRVGSESTSNNESFSWSGPATIAILGYQGARAPYTLTLQ